MEIIDVIFWLKLRILSWYKSKALQSHFAIKRSSHFCYALNVSNLIYLILIMAVFCIFNSKSTFATDYSISMNTSGDVSLVTQNNTTAIDSSEINVTTNCRAGYDLTLSTSVSDNNLYLGGDSSNNTGGTYFAPSNGLTALIAATNTWGYYYSSDTSIIPTASNIFSPVPNNASFATIKTTQETASQQDIDDTFYIYYGANVGANISAGTYQMVQDTSTHQAGGLSYYLTAAPSCLYYLDITFNKNLDGAGGETGDTVSNFPSSSENILDSVNNTLTLSSKIPTRSGYTFKEWNTSADGTGSYYYPGAVINIGDGTNPHHTNASGPNGSNTTSLRGAVTLYAIWIEDCDPATICYNGNHADDGTMEDQNNGTVGSSIALIAPNFSRNDYAFTGWNTAPDGSGTQYGPNQNFTLPSNGATLYAQWLAPTGTLQTWAGASNMNTGDVIALYDNRDDEVYTVAKLADGKVWITENLRLVLNNVTLTDHNTNNPTATFLTEYNVASSNMCADSNDACIDSVRYNTNNINRSLTPTYNVNDNSSSWYEYGVMYNWYTATAGNGTHSMTSGNVSGDLCPAGWHLPTGGSGGEWAALNTAVNNGATGNDTGLRVYPVNLTRSGDYNPQDGYGTGRGYQGRYWTATAKDNNNAYRIGNSSSDASFIDKSYYKWDGFSIRCIYQGGNIPYEDVHVNFAGSGVTSLTFTNSNYPTETATPSSSTVNLAEGATYDVTATTSAGYEIASWATTSAGTLGDTTTVNPAPSTNTYSVTGEATITITGQAIPSYEVNLTLGEHVASVSFADADLGTITITPQSASCTDNNDGTYSCTTSLKRGINYTLSSTFENGYSLDEYVAGTNSTIGSTSSFTTTYSITGNTTLSITAKEAEELEYTLIYSAGSGTDAPTSETESSYNTTHNFTVSSRTPIYYGYKLTGWSETPDANNNGTTLDYVAGDTITITSTGTATTKTLYPVYATVANCPAGKICYYDNGADIIDGGIGTISNRSATSGGTAKLIPTNYSRTGSGFAGWTTAENATPYGPNATINVGDISSSGLALYAKWVPSSGDLQSWTGCSSLAQNSVIALTDTRDNNTYAVAKLADGNCWTIENLRLDPSTANITNGNTNNPASSFATEAAGSSSSNSLCVTDDSSSCINSLQYNTNSLNRSLTQSHNTTGNNVAWYSYGVYYNWYTATAGNGTMGTAANNNTTGDLCPKNWHLPTSTTNGEWVTLNNDINGGITNADANLRAYPVNLIWSGDYNGDSRTNGYSNGRYWSSTGYDANNAYRMGHQESGSKGATPRGNYKKWDAFAIRCVRDETAGDNNNENVTPQSINPDANNSTHDNTASPNRSLTTADSTSTTDNTETITTDTIASTNATDTYINPLGVSEDTTHNDSTTSTVTALAVAAAVSATSGALFLILAKHRSDEEIES